MHALNVQWTADTKFERNTWMEKAYPRLKRYCQARGYEFQVVDMRWGVRDEATDDHRGTELCLRELELCQTLSTGPNFVVSYATEHFFFSNIDFENKVVRGVVGMVTRSCHLYDIMRIVALIHFTRENYSVTKFALEGCFWVWRLLTRFGHW